MIKSSAVHHLYDLIYLFRLCRQDDRQSPYYQGDPCHLFYPWNQLLATQAFHLDPAHLGNKQQLTMKHDDSVKNTEMHVTSM